MSDLLATLKPTALGTLYQQVFGGYEAPVSTATAAQLGDGLDTVFWSHGFEGDGTDAGQGYSQVLQPITVYAQPGPIEKVRVRIRARRSSVGGLDQIAPSIGGGEAAIAVDTTTAFVWYEFDLALDPVDDQPWTAARINGYTWGWIAFETSVDEFSNKATRVCEFQVQVWGTLQTSGGIGLAIGEALAGGASLWTVGGIAIAAGLGLAGATAHGTVIGGLAEAVGEGLASEPSSGYVHGAPAIVTLNSPVIRAVSPGTSLGDGDLLTHLDHVVVDGSAGGTLEVMATAMADSAETGTIEHIIFRANAFYLETSSVFTPSNERMGWSVGGVAAEAPITVPLEYFDEGFRGSDPHYRETAPIYTQPSGAPWTWDAIAALVNVAVRADYPLGSGRVELGAAEIWIEVHGVPGEPSAGTRIIQGAQHVTGPEPIQRIGFSTVTRSTRTAGATIRRKAVIVP